jgi:hypothetical protein
MPPEQVLKSGEQRQTKTLLRLSWHGPRAKAVAAWKRRRKRKKRITGEKEKVKNYLNTIILKRENRRIEGNKRKTEENQERANERNKRNRLHMEID